MSYVLIDPASERLVVDLTTPPTDGQILVYDAASDSWIPGTASGGGGSDPWTYVVLGSDFSSTNTTASPDDVTGWTFTPAANKQYFFDIRALANAASTATGIRPGYSNSLAGTAKCGMYLNVPNGAAGTFIRNLYGTGGSNKNSQATASLSATPHLIHAHGMIISGASPSGAFQVTLCTEVGGSAVTLLAGSVFRYMEVA